LTTTKAVDFDQFRDYLLSMKIEALVVALVARCATPIQVTSGKFQAFRNALSDDAAFTRYMNLNP
jgi:hypothetical protein